jgi:DNA-binding NarL/FixJ family response regulator
MKKVRILLADDHRLFAEGIAALLPAEFELVGIAEDGYALLEMAKKTRPDVIIADVTMPSLNGIDAIERLKKEDLRTKVIFLTMHQDAAYASRAFEAGASGFLLKHSAPDELLMAIRAVLQGQTYVTPAILGELMHINKEEREQVSKDPCRCLTSRQREVLQLLAKGKTAREIAMYLNISPRTAEFHKYRIMEVLGFQHSSELIHFAVKSGLLSI